MNEISIDMEAPLPLSSDFEEQEVLKRFPQQFLGSLILSTATLITAHTHSAEGGGRKRRLSLLSSGGVVEEGGIVEEAGLDPFLEPSSSSPDTSPPYSPPSSVSPLSFEFPIPEGGNGAAAHVLWINRTLGQGTLAVIWNKKELKERGDQIEHVHPFFFLATIVNDPLARESIRKVMQQSLAYDPTGLIYQGFMGGVNRGIEREREEGTLHYYVKDFATKVRGDAAQIMQWIEAGGRQAPAPEWSGLVRYLLEVNKPPHAPLVRV